MPFTINQPAKTSSMGLFSSLKNFVTGGGADVSLEVISKASLGSAVLVRVTAEIGEQDIEIDYVSVRVVATESVKIPNVEVAKTVAEQVQVEKKTIEHSENTFSEEEELTSRLTLNANQSYTWETEIDIPLRANPTFEGENARHYWRAMASLEMRGNDPDSGWLDFEVSA